MINQIQPLPFTFPTIHTLQPQTDTKKFKRITLVHPNSIEKIQNITAQNIQDFNSKHKVTLTQNEVQIQYVNFLKADKEKIQLKSKVLIDFDKELESNTQFGGVLSNFLSSSYQHSLKTVDVPKAQPEVYFKEETAFIKEVIQLAKSKSYARQLANQRANVATTEFMEEECRRVAKQCDIQITVLSNEDLQKQNCNLIVAVGRGSVHKPRLVSLNYKGNPTSEETLALVGKGLCFDSGGLSIKSTSSMVGMFLDKHGSCSVLSAIRSISKLKLKINVSATFAFTQNSIGSDCYRPSDIIKSRQGLTVEIANTDAEGRLTLADVMHWVLEKYNPTHLIEMSTLTGGVVSALGYSTAGLFTNDEQLTKQLLQAGKVSKDRLWPLPLLDDHRDYVKGKVADLTNSSGKTAASASQGAAFLQNFVPKGVKWAHIDIAGAGMIDNMGTGFGSRLLIKYVQSKVTSE